MLSLDLQLCGFISLFFFVASHTTSFPYVPQGYHLRDMCICSLQSNRTHKEGEFLYSDTYSGKAFGSPT
jgi:hypothetical protein